MSSIEQLHPILPTMPPTLTKSEILCNSQEQDKFLPDEGIDSSATMELKPGRTVNSCKRYFIAPESSGLFIRLVRNENQSIDPARRNLTEFCPLSIVSMKSIESMMITLTLKITRHSHVSRVIKWKKRRAALFSLPLFNFSFIAVINGYSHDSMDSWSFNCANKMKTFLWYRILMYEYKLGRKNWCFVRMNRRGRHEKITRRRIFACFLD